MEGKGEFRGREREGQEGKGKGEGARVRKIVGKEHGRARRMEERNNGGLCTWREGGWREGEREGSTLVVH